MTKQKTISKKERAVVFTLLTILAGAGGYVIYDSITTAASCDIYCDSCSSCMAAISDPANNYICMNASIPNIVGDCIDNPDNFTGKTFDCQGYTIDGDNTDLDYGIYLNSKENNTIQNCDITEFNHGIYLYSSSNNILTNNTANDNTYGIYLYSSSNYNNLTDNTANDNIHGIYLYSSSNYNNLTDNTANDNGGDGINLVSSSNYNALINNIVNDNSGDGIYVSSTSNNNLTDNTANNNKRGIMLTSSSNYTTLTNNTANNNTYYGILLSSSSNNTITNNTANYNAYDGIYLWSSSNYNTITNNTANYNDRGGLLITADSQDNTINLNTFCNNNQDGGSYYDIKDADSNTGDNNTCNTTSNWNDAGEVGCTYPCQLKCGDGLCSIEEGIESCPEDCLIEVACDPENCLVNTINITATTIIENVTVFDSSTHDVDCVDIEVQKTSDPVKFKQPGETITYTYNITNTGCKPYLIEDIQFIDNKIEGTFEPNSSFCINPSGENLNPTKSIICSLESILYHPTENTVNASTTYLGQTVWDIDTLSVDYCEPLEINKIANVTEIFCGDTIEYTLSIYAPNCDWNNLYLKDTFPEAELDWKINISSGQNWTYSYTKTFIC